jgi:hypothetical protein
VAGEYLVVWTGDDLFDFEIEVYGQRLDADGAETGANDFRISDTGGTGVNPFAAFNPAVAYNPVDDEYLVVWYGNDDLGGLMDDEFEVFAQRLDADGLEIGDNDLRISDMGDTGDPAFDAFLSPGTPAIAHDPPGNGTIRGPGRCH